MSRWNPCCCAPGLAILPNDMVLVRAGWHHFMVMTRDGKINVFIGYGSRATSDGSTKFLTKGIGSQGIVGNNGSNIYSSPGGVTSCWEYDELGLRNLTEQANLDHLGWMIWDYGDHGDDPYNQTLYWVDYTDPTGYGGWGSKPFGGIHMYPEACSGWGGTTGISASDESVGDYINGDGYYSPTFGFANTPPEPVLIEGCPYYKIRGNVDGLNLNPHGYLNFDGSGATVSRVPGTLRQQILIEAKGLCASPGITGVTFTESYDEVAKPVPAGHPLQIPTDLYDRLYTTDPEEIPEEVVDIECGAYHNIVRLSDNSIVCWGLNSMGQCNVPDSLKPDWSRPDGVEPHPKKNLICSIHAGFSTTAVLFNDGTVLCWGDPDVADVVNTWEHIRISPIRRHGNSSNCCNGSESDGWIDVSYPQFPENKYKNGNYNVNTDWFGLWRTGKPSYPHFDLGVETNRNYPVNWQSLQSAGLSPDETLLPGYYCYTCNDSSLGGITVGKDFAVAMLRTGQIVTTRKVNAKSPGAPLCRDCSTDNYYTVSNGLVTQVDKGRIITYGFDSQGNDCEALAILQGIIEKCPDVICDEYKRWILPANYADCSTEPNTEGIGCISSNPSIESILHDPNWAIVSSFYTPGQQVRPTTHPLGPAPSWNSVDATYGWTTKVASVDRSRLNSNGLAGYPTGCQVSDDYTPSKCVMDLGNAECTKICPSDGGWGDFRRGSNQNGVPGYFSYPLHMAVALTCVAGTNTVNWMYSPKTLSPEQVEEPIFSGGGAGPEEAQIKATTDLVSDCVNYHAFKSGCSECDYVGGNPLYHTQEHASNTTACIYSNNTDVDGIHNPLKEDTSTNCGGIPTLGGILQYMLPTKPWGPWQLSTVSGLGTPPHIEMDLCNFNILSRDYCSYLTIGQNPVVNEPASFAFGGIAFGTDSNVPGWFGLHYGGGPSFINIDETQIGGMGVTRRAIRRDGGIWPFSGVWETTFFNPNTSQYCYYPDECNNPPPSPEEIQSPVSGRCPEAPVDPTSPQQPLAYINCGQDVGPCAGGILGGQIPNLAKYCYPDTFPNLRACTDNSAIIKCGAENCDQGMGNTCNKWFFRNPAISYATGRAFGVFIRRSPWYRGISGMTGIVGITGITGGEFIWEKTCPQILDDTSPKDSGQLGWNRLFEGIVGTKIWVTGLMHDACPPWPLKDDESGITYGKYPSWVPVPSNTSGDAPDRSARKGVWKGTVGSRYWEYVGFTGATGHETTINISGFTYDKVAQYGLNFIPDNDPTFTQLTITEALREYIS